MNVSKKKNVYASKALIIILMCCVVFGVMSCASSKNAEKNDAIESNEAFEASSPEGKDILFYARNLIKNHYGISNLVSVDVFYKESIATADRLDAAMVAGKTNGERLTMLYYELSRLAAMLHDGHTSIGMTEDIISNLSFYPFNVEYISKKLILTAVDNSYAEYIGKEITEINGKSAEDVISALRTIVSYDTEAYAISGVLQKLNNEQALDFVGVGAADEMLCMKFDDGSEIMFEPLSVGEFNSKQFCSLVTNVEKTLYVDSYYTCYDLSEETLFVQYNACMNADGYSVEDFTNDVIGFIDNNGFSRVIVDLRFNGGGNSNLLNPFIRQLGKRISSGQCKGFVLIGTSTFSSAVLNAWDLKKAGCTLVGKPTGGAINHYGEVKTFTLPESGLYASYSTKLFIQDKNAAPGSIMPDVLVEFTVDDLRYGHDVQTAACLDL